VENHRSCNLNLELYEFLLLAPFTRDLPVSKLRSWMGPRTTLVASWQRYPRPYRPANPFDMIVDLVTLLSVVNKDGTWGMTSSTAEVGETWMSSCVDLVIAWFLLWTRRVFGVFGQVSEYEWREEILRECKPHYS
jgi:hypothetical protein